jgi:hypothetical protein
MEVTLMLLWNLDLIKIIIYWNVTDTYFSHIARIFIYLYNWTSHIWAYITEIICDTQIITWSINILRLIDICCCVQILCIKLWQYIRHCVHMEFYVSCLPSWRFLLCVEVHACSYLMPCAAAFSSWVDVMWGRRGTGYVWSLLCTWKAEW